MRQRKGGVLFSPKVELFMKVQNTFFRMTSDEFIKIMNKVITSEKSAIKPEYINYARSRILHVINDEKFVNDVFIFINKILDSGLAESDFPKALNLLNNAPKQAIINIFVVTEKNMNDLKIILEELIQQKTLNKRLVIDLWNDLGRNSELHNNLSKIMKQNTYNSQTRSTRAAQAAQAAQITQSFRDKIHAEICNTQQPTIQNIDNLIIMCQKLIQQRLDPNRNTMFKRFKRSFLRFFNAIKIRRIRDTNMHNLKEYICHKIDTQYRSTYIKLNKLLSALKLLRQVLLVHARGGHRKKSQKSNKSTQVTKKSHKKSLK